jgi:glutaconyl-CoA/methylmalonyl-CoA decarboxylase subunit gamma
MIKLRVKIQNRTYEVEVGDLLARPIQATIDGQVFEVWPEEAATSQAIESPCYDLTPSLPTQMAVPAPVGSTTVVAPIPGVIISIEVNPGDSIERGQTLCILEAMKMKNAIRATRSGRIGIVYIDVGETVGHNQPLIDFTEE